MPGNEPISKTTSSENTDQLLGQEQVNKTSKKESTDKDLAQGPLDEDLAQAAGAHGPLDEDLAQVAGAQGPIDVIHGAHGQIDEDMTEDLIDEALDQDNEEEEIDTYKSNKIEVTKTRATYIHSQNFKRLEWLYRQYSYITSIKKSDLFVLSTQEDFVILLDQSEKKDHLKGCEISDDIKKTISHITNPRTRECIEHVINNSGSDVMNIHCILFLASVGYEHYNKTKNKQIDNVNLRRFKYYTYQQLTNYEKRPTKLYTKKTGSAIDEMSIICHYMIDVFTVMLHLKDPKLAIQAQECELIKLVKRDHKSYVSRVVTDLQSCDLKLAMTCNNTRLQTSINFSNACYFLNNIINLVIFAHSNPCFDKQLVFENFKHWFVEQYLDYLIKDLKRGCLVKKVYLDFVVYTQSLSAFKNETFDKIMDLLHFFLTQDEDENYVSKIYDKISHFVPEDFEIQPVPKKRLTSLQSVPSQTE
ncbi:hypothetical protein AB837_00618 [bacterium AB1]|nr:hypothetical protein AB837_00618 [bacterium AB1]